MSRDLGRDIPYFSYKNMFYFLELISRKLHYTYSFVIQRLHGKIVWGLLSWKIPFQLHKIMFLELVHDYFWLECKALVGQLGTDCLTARVTS